MGCAGSKNTKVVKFQEPKTKPPSQPTTSSVAPSVDKSNPEDKKVDLTPVQEIPKSSEPPPKISLNKNDKEPEKTQPVILEANQEKSTEVLPSVVDGAKSSERKRNQKKKPILNGELDTRETIIDAKTSRIYSPTKLISPPKTLKILHFNDVYNIEPRDQEPVGGAARFVTKINSFEDEPMVLFSGDLLNPSLSKLIS